MNFTILRAQYITKGRLGSIGYEGRKYGLGMGRGQTGRAASDLLLQVVVEQKRRVDAVTANHQALERTTGIRTVLYCWQLYRYGNGC